MRPHARPQASWLRILTPVLALQLVTTPARAFVPPELQEAKALHEEAQARFDTADYVGAIESWTRAYQALPDTPESAAMKPFVLYNIATAREKAYAITDDISHLKQARVLLERFDASIGEIYEDPQQAQAERERVQARLASIDEKIGAHEGQARVADPTPEPAGEPQPIAEPRQAGQSESVDTPPTDAGPGPDRGGRALVISGAVLTGIGGAAAVAALTGMGLGATANDIDDLDPDDTARREERFDRGRAANVVAITGAVVAPLFLAGGIALLVVGKKRGNAASAWVPAVGPQGASLIYRTNF